MSFERTIHFVVRRYDPGVFPSFGALLRKDPRGSPCFAKRPARSLARSCTDCRRSLLVSCSAGRQDRSGEPIAPRPGGDAHARRARPRWTRAQSAGVLGDSLRHSTALHGEPMTETSCRRPLGPSWSTFRGSLSWAGPLEWDLSYLPAGALSAFPQPRRRYDRQAAGRRELLRRRVVPSDPRPNACRRQSRRRSTGKRSVEAGWPADRAGRQPTPFRGYPRVIILGGETPLAGPPSVAYRAEGHIDQEEHADGERSLSRAPARAC
jgi:hypothetical protein